MNFKSQKMPAGGCNITRMIISALEIIKVCQVENVLGVAERWRMDWEKYEVNIFNVLKRKQF